MKLIVVTIEMRCYWPLQTCYDMVTTNPATTNAPQPGHYNLAITRPLQSRHNPVTTNSPQWWSLQIATTWSLQPGHYNFATTLHYEFTTTSSLQTHYNAVTTTPLQSCHTPATTISPQPSHYATTWPLQTHYIVVTTDRSLLWLQIPCSKRTILSTPCLLSLW